MDTRLTLFVGLVFLGLLWNTVLLWFLYRGLARSAERVARYQPQHVLLIRGLQSALERAELASIRATEWSGQIRDGALDTGESMDRADNWLEYGLAKLDFNVDRVSEGLRERTDEIKAAISEPLRRTGSIIQGVGALLEFVTLAQSYRERSVPRFPSFSASSSRPSRRSSKAR